MREIRSKKVMETVVGRIYGKGKFWAGRMENIFYPPWFWVWSRREMEWCIMKVAVMMTVIMNCWE